MALFGTFFKKIREIGEFGEFGGFGEFGVGRISISDWQELEQNLLEADLGTRLTAEILNTAKSDKSATAEEIEASVLAALTLKLSPLPRSLNSQPGRTSTILVVGVNGTGKTTSVAKLMKFLKDDEKKVLVAAADTFRAAAIDQIQTWGERLGVPVISGKPEGDPASVAFDGIKRAQRDGADFFIVDTAGRLHTKVGLMDELSKIRRVVEKVSPIDEVLLVVDATTGQNGITQAKLFAESVAVTGLILTKTDGSAKGGVALAIESETGIPVKFIGTGESAEDLEIFDAPGYLASLLA